MTFASSNQFVKFQFIYEREIQEMVAFERQII